MRVLLRTTSVLAFLVTMTVNNEASLAGWPEEVANELRRAKLHRSHDAAAAAAPSSEESLKNTIRATLGRIFADVLCNPREGLVALQHANFPSLGTTTTWLEGEEGSSVQLQANIPALVKGNKEPVPVSIVVTFPGLAQLRMEMLLTPAKDLTQDAFAYLLGTRPVEFPERKLPMCLSVREQEQADQIAELRKQLAAARAAAAASVVVPAAAPAPVAADASEAAAASVVVPAAAPAPVAAVVAAPAPVASPGAGIEALIAQAITDLTEVVTEGGDSLLELKSQVASLKKRVSRLERVPQQVSDQAIESFKEGIKPVLETLRKESETRHAETRDVQECETEVRKFVAEVKASLTSRLSLPVVDQDNIMEVVGDHAEVLFNRYRGMCGLLRTKCRNLEQMVWEQAAASAQEVLKVEVRRGREVIALEEDQLRMATAFLRQLALVADRSPVSVNLQTRRFLNACQDAINKWTEAVGGALLRQSDMCSVLHQTMMVESGQMVVRALGTLTLAIAPVREAVEGGKPYRDPPVRPSAASWTLEQNLRAAQEANEAAERDRKALEEGRAALELTIAEFAAEKGPVDAQCDERLSGFLTESRGSLSEMSTHVDTLAAKINKVLEEQKQEGAAAP